MKNIFAKSRNTVHPALTDPITSGLPIVRENCIDASKAFRHCREKRCELQKRPPNEFEDGGEWVTSGSPPFKFAFVSGVGELTVLL